MDHGSMGAREQAIVHYYTAPSYLGGIPPKVGMTASDPYRQMVRNVAACSKSLGPRLVGKMIVGMASGARRATIEYLAKWHCIRNSQLQLAKQREVMLLSVSRCWPPSNTERLNFSFLLVPGPTGNGRDNGNGMATAVTLAMESQWPSP